MAPFSQKLISNSLPLNNIELQIFNNFLIPRSTNPKSRSNTTFPSPKTCICPGNYHSTERKSNYRIILSTSPSTIFLTFQLKKFFPNFRYTHYCFSRRHKFEPSCLPSYPVWLPMLPLNVKKYPFSAERFPKASIVTKIMKRNETQWHALLHMTRRFIVADRYSRATSCHKLQAISLPPPDRSPTLWQREKRTVGEIDSQRRKARGRLGTE